MPIYAERVIVSFKEGSALEKFAARSFHTDDARIIKNPEKWGYISKAVIGAVQSLESTYRFKVRHGYSSVFKGFSADLLENQVKLLKIHPLVASVSPVVTVHAVSQTLPWGIDRVDADLSFAHAGDGVSAVSNVNIYVIDTGVDATHPDLNVIRHLNFTNDGKNYDCHGHGTHVAGTIAAKDDAYGVVGVAPGAPITALKVLGCNGIGSSDDVIKAIDWVTVNRSLPAVANMSLGGPANEAQDNSVIKSAQIGRVFYALAAGNNGDGNQNGGKDACLNSPARAGRGDNGVITTAASDLSNAEAHFSNYGACVDIWAPGVSILSTYPVSNSPFAYLSGTSMASPHVAGGAAVYLSFNENAKPLQVEQFLKQTSLYLGTLSKDNSQVKIENVANIPQPPPTEAQKNAAITVINGFLLNNVCTYILRPASKTVPKTGGVFQSTLVTQPACSWQLKSNAAWLSINSNINGKGNAVITYNVKANATVAKRTGKITLTSLDEPTIKLNLIVTQE